MVALVEEHWEKGSLKTIHGSLKDICLIVQGKGYNIKERSGLYS